MKPITIKKFYREDLPKILKKKKLIGIELGVAKGNFAKTLSKFKNFEYFFGVDSYSLNHHNDEEYISALKKIGIFAKYRIIRSTFDDALKLFPNNSVDFIYFDGYAHTGQNYGKTIIDWSKKIKKNGILAGDDYDEKWELNKQIIDQFAKDNNLRLYLTDVKKNHRYKSWFIKIDKKISSNSIKYSKFLKYKETIKSFRLYIPFIKKNK